MFLECGNCGRRLTASHAAADSRGVPCPHCGATVPIFDQNTLVSGSAASVAPLVDLRIEGYEILGCLGEGGMGIVYLARQVSLDRKVAIKVMSPVLLKDPSFVARFDREIAALVRLSHPHIVTIFDRGQSAGHVYYIMEYVEGNDGGAPMDVEHLIADRCLNSQRTRALMLQVVQALGFAHREGIIHRDIKPSNILIDRHGFAKVADFGIASMRASGASRHVTMANQSVGTVIYMSPEQQHDAASVDHRSDIYATGVMLYQMLTGELPVAGYEPPSKAVAGLSPQWDAVVAKALQQRPENRFPDMQAFETALTAIGQTATAQPSSPPPPRPAPPPGAPGGTPASRPAPSAIPQSGVANRADVIKRAEQLFAQGQWKKAAELMGKAARFFVADGEIAALAAQYRQQADQLDEVLARMATLAQQNRWCEVSQIIAELRQSGVSVQGVGQYAATAQQRFATLQPLVTTARTLLQQGHTTEAVAHANRALQYVADHAEALEIADAAGKRSTRRRRSRRYVGGLIAVACLAAIAGGAYLYFTESVVIDKARRQIADRKYEEASQTLADLPHRWFVERSATYLQAMTDLKKYASAKAVDGDAPLHRSTQRLQDLFKASEMWRAQAKNDLADAVAQVPPPPDAEDTLTRVLKIARVLDELKAAEPAVLADALLTKAEGRREFQSPASDATPADYVGQILKWDHAKARKVIDLARPKEGSAQPGLAAIRGWADKTPSLAGDLRAAVLQVADEYVTAGRYKEAKPFADTAKRIDSHFDTWSYWEGHFHETDGKNSQDAMDALTFMVEGEQNPERLEKATNLYNDLRKRCPGVARTPPPEIRELADTARFRELIADANESGKNGQYQDARAKLDEAHRQFSSLWRRDADADRLDQEVRFHLDVEMSRQSFARGDWATALAKATDALQVRPDDKEAAELRDKIQTAADKAEVQQHRQQAASAVTADDPRGAVDEIVKAYGILKKPSNAAWSAPIRGAVDELAKTVVGKLHEQATKLFAKRRYDDAKEKVSLGLRLSSKDEALSQLRNEIEQREADPKTASLSGRWMALDGTSCRLTDDGTDTIGYEAVKLPDNVSCVGTFKRQEAKLEGHFQVATKDASGQVTRSFERTMSGTIQDSKTVAFLWEDRTAVNGSRRLLAKGEATWTKQQDRTNESAAPADAAEPTACAPGHRPTPRRSRKTHQDSLGARTKSARGLHAQEAPDFAAEPQKNGVVVGGDLSIAIVQPITKQGDAAEITLGFRRVSSRWEGHDWMRLTVHDDRSNEYSSPNFGLDGGGESVKGRPPAIKQLPVGFTWVSRIEVPMPGIAIGHIAKIELSEGLLGGDRHSLDWESPGLPSLEFRIPAEQLLSPGKNLPLDKNLVAEIGELAADGSSVAARGVSLSLPISVTNEDYNPHPSDSFNLYVQSENGEVWEYATIGDQGGWRSEAIPGKTTQKLRSSLVDSASRGLPGDGLHAVLLYRRSDTFLSEPRFCGFIPIPDDLRQRLRRTASEPSPGAGGERGVRAPRPAKPRSDQE
jgi:serine/threonine protein kinase